METEEERQREREETRGEKVPAGPSQHSTFYIEERALAPLEFTSTHHPLLHTRYF